MSGWRAAALAAALFAMTFYFLQPLVRAALTRDGGPVASALWKSMCLASGQDEGAPNRQKAGRAHECCLGLAHAPALPAVPASFVAVQFIVAVIDPPVVAIDALQPIGIRDGPAQPHGPPLIV